MISIYRSGHRVPTGWPDGPASQQTLELTALMGETVSFQIGVPASGVDRPVSVADEARIFRAHEIRVDPRMRWVPGRLGAGIYYDGLTEFGPADSLPPADKPSLIWVDIVAAFSGDHVIPIKVGEDEATLRLTVLDAPMPSTSALALVGLHQVKLDEVGEPWQTWAPRYVDLARAHGLEVMLRGFGMQTPAYYDSLKERIQAARRWAVPLPPNLGIPYFLSSSDGIQRAVSKIRQSWQQHVLPESRAYVIGYDEPGSKPGLDYPTEARGWYNIVKRAWPELRVMTCDDWGRGEPRGTCDILASPAHTFDPALSSYLVGSGAVKEQWLYQGMGRGLPGEYIDWNVPGLRAWPWLSMLWNVAGNFLWSGNCWYAADPWSVPDGQPSIYNDGEGTLFYPGARPSIRLKQWHRGMQDRALLEAAREIDALTTMAILAASSKVPGDPQWWDDRADQLRAIIAGKGAGA